MNEVNQLWKTLTREQIKTRVFDAIGRTLDFYASPPLGLPGSSLDPQVFCGDAPFLRDAPFMSAMIRNMNHIGCHTFGESEPHFPGTHEIEREVVRICAEEIFLGQPDAHDGYIASGGTEANIEAVWIYRNFFQTEHGADASEIAVLSSADAHYSIPKACNLLALRHVSVPVDERTRELDPDALGSTIREGQAEAVKYWIVVANLGTTMFGSVDSCEMLTDALIAAGDPFKLHIDAAFGGFVYPFTGDTTALSFANPRVDSIALDAHKVVQAPYGTGIFLIRKGLMQHVSTAEAKYVTGLDATLIGSRSGANAVAIWMILMTYGPDGWREKVGELIDRTDWLCGSLKEAGRQFYRHPRMNVVALRADEVSRELASEFLLVPDVHSASPRWYKVVVMDHVTHDRLREFVGRLG
jgi:glutamate/tyrosine decarboxylase-like PLP-dependent enzyme